MYGHDAQCTGRSDYKGPDGPVKEKWSSFPIGESLYIMGPSIASDGTIYLGASGHASEVDGPPGKIYAINPDGTEKWSFTASVYNSSYERTEWAYKWGFPTIGADGTIYTVGDGAHTLHVQERDALGNWSASGTFAVIVDTAAPSAPTVIGATPAPIPNWTWTSGGSPDSAGKYRFRLDDNDLSGEPETSDLSHTEDLPEGTYRLYVQERDTVGNWSLSASHDIVVDETGPVVADVSSEDSDDVYTQGESLTITVRFNETVEVSGTPDRLI